MKSVFRIPVLLIVTSTLIFLLSCCRKNAPQKSQAPAESARQNATQLVSPKTNTVINCGDSVSIKIRRLNEDIQIDSLVVIAGKKSRRTIPGYTENIYWPSRGSRVGQITLQVIVYYNDSLRESHNAGLVVLSDIVPRKYNYRVIRQFPHDNQAYTQGLVYDNGVLYESTGLEGQSSLRIVDIPSGKPKKMVSLSPLFFGEGIALYRDQVYQVTYKSQVGFVYDKNTLEQIRSFDYQIKEGWGLTTDGKNLIMSDGSAQLYFIEPEYFTQVDQVEVFDNKGLIDSLNEIEYIQGKVLANVYGESYIVIVDPSTGKVTGKVELQDLMPKGFKGDYGKVLNGIAFNPLTGHLYITGKNWPVLYEIELVPAL
ncbi:MAG: glutaminyl-peptide cyclotransferase [Bacteroidales bacterium]|nr:glutaminyl-peptide cyclotransferase [Bacteroidales bacterium]